MELPKVIASSSIKENIFYDAVCIPDNHKAEDIEFMSFMKEITPDFEDLKPKEMPTGIIYCNTNEDVENVVAKLRELNIPAVKFYASYVKRFDDYEDWMSDKVPVIVATTESFGLGIVKRFVKFVIHTNVPKDLRGYYQVNFTKL
jgi:superfamily II DNA helicase RecQ